MLSFVVDISVTQETDFSKILQNILEIFKEKFLEYYMHSDVCIRLDYSPTLYCAKQIEMVN